jgi:hypothetical protein
MHTRATELFFIIAKFSQLLKSIKAPQSYESLIPELQRHRERERERERERHTHTHTHTHLFLNSSSAKPEEQIDYS